MEAIDIMRPSWSNLVEWLNSNKRATLTTGSAVLMDRYLKGWKEHYSKGTISPEGVAELMIHYFPNEVKTILGQL